MKLLDITFQDLAQAWPKVVKKDGINYCEYRTEDGRACAVGCLIPDEVYDKYIGEEGKAEFENIPVNHLKKYPELVDIVNGEGEDGQKKLAFLVEAQRIHDSFADDAKDFVRLLDELVQNSTFEIKIRRD